MARATGVQAAAIRRRIKHERRIDEQVNPLTRLVLTLAMVRAEAGRHPHLLEPTTARLHQIAVELNDLEANPAGKEATR
jgi:hypothetical protein